MSPKGEFSAKGQGWSVVAFRTLFRDGMGGEPFLDISANSWFDLKDAELLMAAIKGGIEFLKERE